MIHAPTNLPWFDASRWSDQAPVVEEIVQSFNNNRLVIADCPTGSGKTVIAEAVRQTLNPSRSLYLCTTLSLQDQWEKDFGHVGRVLKGRRNYPTLGYPTEFRRNGFGQISCSDCDKVRDPADGTWDCSYCPDVARCPYEIAKLKALSAPLSCTNMRYALTELNNVGRFAGQPYVTVDEADTVEDALMGYVELRVSRRWQKLIGLNPPAKKTVQSSWVEWFKPAMVKVEAAVSQRNSLLAKRKPGAHDPKTLVLMRERAYCERLLKKLEVVGRRVAEGGWVYTGYEVGDICFKPVRIDEELGRQYLWKHGDRWLLMSGTVIEPNVLAESLGWTGEFGYVRMPWTFPADRRPIRYAPVADMTSKLAATEVPKMADAVVRVADLHPGERVLVHTHSYGLAQTIAERLSQTPHADRTYTYLDADSRAWALEKYLARDDGILVAPSMERGMDFADDKCRVVVVCKVPYPNLGDKQISSRLYSTGGSLWYRTHTIRALVQMTGRGMRHKDDRCTSYLLDKQFRRIWDESRHLLPKEWVEAISWNGSWRATIEGA